MGCRYLYFTEKDVRQRWNEVKSEEEFWSQLSYRLKRMTKTALEAALREERRVYILNASRYERTEGRTDQRNGRYERDLLTVLGLIRGSVYPLVTAISLIIYPVLRFFLSKYLLHSLLHLPNLLPPLLISLETPTPSISFHLHPVHSHKS